ncbi:MAG: ribbon-helix-helix protein, CopG family [Syntrophomonas sp.]|nr:ribbon-helix-helix protein, CopG family [Syntrophomonas sp.]
MPASKRIIVSISEILLSEVDSITVLDKRNRSEIVRDAIKFYLEKRKREIRTEQMKKGYLEMAPINLTIATESMGIEEEVLVWQEYKPLE